MRSWTNKHSAHGAHFIPNGDPERRRRHEPREPSWQHDWLQARAVFVLLLGQNPVVAVNYRCVCEEGVTGTKCSVWKMWRDFRKEVTEWGEGKESRCKIHTAAPEWSTFSAPTLTSIAVVAFLLKAAFDLLQPLRHGHDEHFHLERSGSGMETRGTFWDGKIERRKKLNK